MAAALSRRFAFYALPVSGTLCLGYSAYEAWRVFGGPSQEEELLALWRKESIELNGRRLDWVSRRTSAKGPALFSAEVVQDVHNKEALGSAGIILRVGETVSVLEEGAGAEQGFNIVQRPEGDVGIYPKAYLRRKDEGSKDKAKDKATE
mmetsp:Transcript_50419/g.109509  ORF Transcript_50419/g.109509 Transcript_50419/m.109509 type:complete len:149 (+) Transcript_50419:55-501(+)